MTDFGKMEWTDVWMERTMDGWNKQWTDGKNNGLMERTIDRWNGQTDGMNYECNWQAYS